MTNFWISSLIIRVFLFSNLYGKKTSTFYLLRVRCSTLFKCRYLDRYSDIMSKPVKCGKEVEPINDGKKSLNPFMSRLMIEKNPPEIFRAPLGKSRRGVLGWGFFVRPTPSFPNRKLNPQTGGYSYSFQITHQLTH